MSELKVCAVVVTYNRKEQLKHCLKALLDQTRPLDTLLIVDNKSTDDTPEMLLDLAYINHLPQNDLTEPYLISSIKPIRNQAIDPLNGQNNQGIESYYELNVMYVRMHKNTGGAGGFHEGVKRGYELGNDWLWLMDDDGIPDKYSLSNLLRYTSKGDFLNTLVLDFEEKDKLSFDLFGPKNNLIITKSDAYENSEDGAIHGQVNPFNGTLISKSLVSKIGLPMKELFIWGDEVEYQKRATRAGFGVATIVSAIHYHPKARTKQVKIPIIPYHIAWSGVPIKDYCSIRNTVYIHKKYYKKTVLLTTMIKYLTLFAFKPSISSFGIWFNATFDGLFNRWGREKRYL